MVEQISDMNKEIGEKDPVLKIAIYGKGFVDKPYPEELVDVKDFVIDLRDEEIDTIPESSFILFLEAFDMWNKNKGHDWVCTMDDDARLDNISLWIERLDSVFEKGDTGALGPMSVLRKNVLKMSNNPNETKDMAAGALASMGCQAYSKSLISKGIQSGVIESIVDLIKFRFDIPMYLLCESYGLKTRETPLPFCHRVSGGAKDKKVDEKIIQKKIDEVNYDFDRISFLFPNHKAIIEKNRKMSIKSAERLLEKSKK